ncbi:T9SS type A sorting domain-containing protein [Pseudoflavitalea sp. G-6-1-2]|uniref:FG-GAP-like repeat-containing protein n=1 Tax=Pseudoflavitalea sp. G-6-1-2 TaxID=2728841 RepID=UPI00146A8CE5|nr:FG-GAP-like repeat-containing protein [Pseudoflavitalea sp. G-6-1-2]NML23810.1 T9SS type A sorting domain-containing protein [Pseudoflavitalea sp. G-6-1-2]
MRMRTFTKLAMLIVTVLFAGYLPAQYNGPQFNVHAAPAPPAKGNSLLTKELPEGISQDWFSSTVENLKKMEYNFRPGSQKTVQVVNTANRVGFDVQHDALTVNNVLYSPKDVKWSSTFAIQGIGREKFDLLKSLSYTKEINGSEMVYKYANFDIQYLNDEKGLRQNFIVKNAPAGEGQLKVHMSIKGDLQPELQSANKLVLQTKNRKQETKFIYDGLKVWDANQQLLAAHMELDQHSNALTIVVDDKNAVYPVTIDPLTHTPDWATSADGVLPGILTSLQLQVDAAYGYGVAGLGDLNGDGFDDIAVYSPTCIDVIGPTNFASAGAVFVYLGSATGLPLVPSKVLRSQTPIAGALFGWSVAAGDVTGDGRPDVIVGAPLDMVSIDFGGPLGILSGTVGAVHVFNGATITTAPNPLARITFNTTTITNLGIAKNQLFGFSVGYVNDINADGKGEIITGTPVYEGVSLTTGAKIGGAFIYLSNPGNTFTNVVSLKPPTGTQLGLSAAVQAILVPVIGNVLWTTVVAPLVNPILNAQQIDGVLYGWAVDGTGDYNNDGIPDVVVGAPGGGSVTALLGAVLGSLSGAVQGALSGQVLGGQAYIYKGLGTAAGADPDYIARLQASSSGLLSNAANFFGFKVLGARNGAGVRTGAVLVGAPLGGTLTNVLSLGLKAGNIHVFKKSVGAIPTPVVSDQRLETPRNTSILTLLSSLAIKPSILYGTAMDNMYDVNKDGIGDLIVGEPLSTGVDVAALSADALGGMAHVYLGKADGTYYPYPVWSVGARNDGILSLNAASMLGFSVAGAGHVRGALARPRALVGAPGRALDFSSLLNIPGSLGTLLGFAAGGNGLGKAYTFDLGSVLDHDDDGVTDSVDVDDDNDGIADRYEFGTSFNAFFTPTNDPAKDDDGDGIPNYMDPNNPQGGGLNAAGICVNYDTDGDGVPNNFDLDSDNDGVADVIEAGAVDADGNGRIDCVGGCDADVDGLLNSVDVAPATPATYAGAVSKMSNGTVPGSVNNRILDTDGDGVPDFIDIDSDNDAIFDIIELGGADFDGNGRVDFVGAFINSDPDEDGWINLYDADTDNDGLLTGPGEGTAKALVISTDANTDGIADGWSDGPGTNTFQVDFDNDLRINSRDLDSDNDGINDVLEAGGADPDGNGLINTGTPTVGASGYVTGLTNPLIITTPDSDGDGRPNDNPDPNISDYQSGNPAPFSFRPDQDGDTRPNFLDLDSDNDGIDDLTEGGVDRDGNGVGDAETQDANKDGMIDNLADADFDGIADAVDFNDAAYGDGKAPTGTSDPRNTDGVDPNPTLPDSDNVPDYMDLDSDNDGAYDVYEGGNPSTDAVHDGIVDCAGGNAACDTDEDGISTPVDAAPASIGDGSGPTLPDTDGDGTPNYRDLDSDNDGMLDENEYLLTDIDLDNDGRVDGVDLDGDGLINVLNVDANTVFGGSPQLLSPLPITLTEFKGTANNKAVLLNWSASLELNADRYELQRSNDGNTFENIASVPAKNSSVGNDYAYTDWTASSGNNYYRLRMVDKDGTYKFSNIVVIKFTGNLSANIEVAPNPVQTQFIIRFAGLEKGIYRMRLFNQLGQETFAQEIYLNSNVQTQTIARPSALPSGTYWLSITDKNNNRVKSMKLQFR